MDSTSGAGPLSILTINEEEQTNRFKSSFRERIGDLALIQVIAGRKPLSYQSDKSQQMVPFIEVCAMTFSRRSIIVAEYDSATEMAMANREYLEERARRDRGSWLDLQILKERSAS